MSGVVSAAKLYISKGWQVVPLHPRSKACIGDNWEKIVFAPEHFDPDSNIGIRSLGGLVDVDCDAPEVVAVAKHFLPTTGCIYGRPAKPRAHYLYHAPFEKIIALKDTRPDAPNSTLIEIRVNHQSMAPPSIHPDGQVLEWEEPIGDAPHIAADLLLRSVRLAATCGLVIRYYNVPGQRHDWGLALSAFFRQLNITEDEARQIFKHAGAAAGDSEVQDRLQAVKSTYSRGEDDAQKSTRALAELMQHGKPFITSIRKIWGGASEWFILDEKGEKVIANHEENIRRALVKMEYELAYNEFSHQMLYRNGTKKGVVDDAFIRDIWFNIHKRFHFRPTKDFFTDSVNWLAETSPIHPVKDYLAGLTWDGVPRLERWLIDSAKAADTEYVRVVSTIVLVAAVRRVRQPGCKFDEMLVLESEQGWDKSNALRALCIRDDWFADDLPLNVDAKQIIERTGGKWLVEAGELSGMRRTQVEHLKAMLSRQIDGPVRMAYGRFSVERPRQFVIIGTTNAHTYLKDTTGNRRFWSIRVQRFNIQWLKDNRDQIWAEASHLEKQGYPIRLPEHLYEAAALQQERRRIVDEWEVRLDATFYDREKDWRIAYSEVWDALGVAIANRNIDDQARINSIMQRLGFRRQKVRSQEFRKEGAPAPVVSGWARDASGGQRALLTATERSTALQLETKKTQSHSLDESEPDQDTTNESGGPPDF